MPGDLDLHGVTGKAAFFVDQKPLKISKRDFMSVAQKLRLSHPLQF